MHVAVETARRIYDIRQGGACGLDRTLAGLIGKEGQLYWECWEGYYGTRFDQCSTMLVLDKLRYDVKFILGGLTLSFPWSWKWRKYSRYKVYELFMLEKTTTW